MSEFKLYTLDEVAALLHLTRRTLYNYIKGGKIQAVKIGRTWRVTDDALRAFVADCAEQENISTSANYH